MKLLSKNFRFCTLAMRRRRDFAAVLFLGVGTRITYHEGHEEHEGKIWSGIGSGKSPPARVNSEDQVSLNHSPIPSHFVFFVAFVVINPD